MIGLIRSHKGRLAAAVASTALVALCGACCPLPATSWQGLVVSRTMAEEAPAASFDLSQVPVYDGSPHAIVGDGVPDLSCADGWQVGYESFPELDELGRCGTVEALVGPETMPTEERESIGEVEPSGWQTVRYDDLIEDHCLYNRCHLIGFQLTGENANELNLITGTRYMNVEGMLPIEDMVADYVLGTGNHVAYRATPVFVGEELVARGVRIEALSIEDSGAGVCLDVFCYNVQPGVAIDYATGASAPSGGEAAQQQVGEAEVSYILNMNTDKFHYPECDSVDDMKEENKAEFSGTRDEAIALGYEPCGKCNP